MAFLKKLGGGSDHIELDVKAERFLGKEPICPRLEFHLGTKYVIINKDGLPARTCKREGKEVVLSATKAEVALLVFSTLHFNMALGVGGLQSAWQRKGVVKGSILRRVGDVAVTPFSEDVAGILDDAFEENETVSLQWHIPTAYCPGTDNVTFLPALEKITMEEVERHCVGVTCETKKDKFYLEMCTLQEPAQMEMASYWQPVKLKEGMKCRIMHDILGIMEIEGDGEEDEEEVDIFSSTVVEILKIDKTKKLAEIVICAEPDDKWTVRLSSKEGRPALRPIENLRIHFPPLEPEESENGEGTPKMGFTYDEEELAAFAKKTGEEAAGAEAAVPKGPRPKKAAKRRAKGKAKGKAKTKSAPASDAEDTPGEASKPKKKLKPKGSKVAKSESAPPSEAEGDGDGTPRPKKKTKSKARKSARPESALPSENEDEGYADGDGADGAEPKKKAKKKAVAKKKKTVPTLDD